jgi:hypothetical protein
MRHRIFVGSSTESVVPARAIQHNLGARGHVVKVWDQGIFSIGRTAFETLLAALDDFDAALFVFAPDDLVTIRGSAFAAIRDNVVFELGLFTGRLGRDRTFWLVPRGHTELRIASDLLGVLPAEYTPPADRDWVAALAPACDLIDQALADSARCRGAKHAPLSEERTADILPRVNQALAHLTRAVRTPRPVAVEQLPDNEGFRLRTGTKSELTVTFGRIEHCQCQDAGAVVALPTNEFFDDDCLTDRRSAVGSYLHRRFGDRIGEFRALLAAERAKLQPALVQRETGIYEETYGVGTALFFDTPLGADCRTILCSVTRKRAREGIKAEAAYIFAAVDAISRVMNDKKLTTLHVPLLGAGHGDVAADESLLCLALALVATPDIRHAHIVVFRDSETSTPEVQPQEVRTLLTYVARGLGGR